MTSRCVRGARANSGAARAAAARLIVFSVLMGLVAAGPAAAQHEAETGHLAVARNLYVSAHYEDALELLDRLRENAQADHKQVETYRSLCLLALGRSEEAELAIAAVVTADPTYQLDETDASPRVRATFTDVRRRLLPEIASARYTAARAAYERREWAEAERQFDLVVSLIDDPANGGQLADLRLLAAGFRELSAEAIAAATLPAEPEAPSTETAEPHLDEDESARIFSLADADVVPPVAIRQELPPLPNALTSFARSRGLLEVVVDELGRVVSMSIRESIHPTYDLQLLSAATSWKYEPATREERPVRFRRLIQINIAR